MYCTGGIRCEKATAFMKEQGFDEVYHLKGGILKYLEEVPAEESLWEGACFVFDERVSVDHGLKEGDHKLCHACRNPMTAEEITSPHYEAGVSCSHCYHDRTEEDRVRYRERQRQIALARKRGERASSGESDFRPAAVSRCASLEYAGHLRRQPLADLDLPAAACRRNNPAARRSRRVAGQSPALPSRCLPPSRECRANAASATVACSISRARLSSSTFMVSDRSILMRSKPNWRR